MSILLFLDCNAVRVLNQIVQMPNYAILRHMHGFEIDQVTLT